MRDDVAGPDGSELSEGLGPLAQAVRDVMAHQWSNNREAMDALTRLVDAARDAQEVLGMVADISQSGGLALQSPLDALVSVRRLTLEYWDTAGSEAEHRERVLHAAAEARIRGLRAYSDVLEAEIDRLRRALRDIAEEWAGAECGEPVHAQEAYAIGLAKRMYALAASALRPN